MKSPSINQLLIFDVDGVCLNDGIWKFFSGKTRTAQKHSSFLRCVSLVIFQKMHPRPIQSTKVTALTDFFPNQLPLSLTPPCAGRLRFRTVTPATRMPATLPVPIATAFDLEGFLGTGAVAQVRRIRHRRSGQKANKK